jgi:hypothetical protein
MIRIGYALDTLCRRPTLILGGVPIEHPKGLLGILMLMCIPCGCGTIIGVWIGRFRNSFSRYNPKYLNKDSSICHRSRRMMKQAGPCK